MDTHFFLTYLSQLTGQAPLFLAFLVGAILALVLWSRAPGPALLTFLACLLFLVLNLGHSFLITWFLHSPDIRPVDRSSMFTIVALVTNVFRAGGFAMLLIAVFVGRGRRPAFDSTSPEPSGR